MKTARFVKIDRGLFLPCVETITSQNSIIVHALKLVGTATNSESAALEAAKFAITHSGLGAMTELP